MLSLRPPTRTPSRAPRHAARRLRGLIVVAIAVLAIPAPLLGQDTRAASIDLRVADGATNAPLAGAQVVLAGRGVGMTDAGGKLLLRGLPAREFVLEVRRLGYGSRTVAITASEGQSVQLTVPLELSPVLLPGVRAEVEGARSRELQDFYRRVRTGPGQYITREEIDRRRPRDLTELFRGLPGIRLMRTAAGDKPIMEAKASAMGDLLNPESTDCAIQYFIDGSPIKPIHDGVLGAEVTLGEIEGIEIYRRGSMVPAKYHRLHNSCGVILIWKKERI